MKLGTIQECKLLKKVNFGAYLIDPEETDYAKAERESVLLPAKELENEEIGERITVFLYRDSEDRMIATKRKPLLTLGEVGKLRVSQVNKMGAFLDWGLEKDLFLPFRQQTGKVEEGQMVLVAVYTDKSDRLCSTMNVYPYLEERSPYHTGDDVKGTVYEESDQYGFFVAVDDRYSAIIPRKECYGTICIGDEIRGRVGNVRKDGKLNISIREKAYLQIEPDMEKVLDLLEDYGGVLPFTEKADPDVIRRELGMSKNEFKRAVGHLYKMRKVDISDGKIRLVKEV